MEALKHLTTSGLLSEFAAEILLTFGDGGTILKDLIIGNVKSPKEEAARPPPEYLQVLSLASRR